MNFTGSWAQRSAASSAGFCASILDFVMTAMFVVIFMDQWLKEKHHFSAWIGLIASVACLLIFGADNFLIPTMICILVALTALRKPVEAKTQEAVK